MFANCAVLDDLSNFLPLRRTGFLPAKNENFWGSCVFFSGQDSREHKTQSYSLIEIASTGHCSGVRSAGHGTHRRLKEPCQNQIPAQRTKHGRRNTAWNRTPLRLMVVFCMTKLTKLTNYRNLVKLVKLVTWNFWGSCNANDIALLALWRHESAESAITWECLWTHVYSIGLIIFSMKAISAFNISISSWELSCFLRRTGKRHVLLFVVLGDMG